MDRQLAIVVDGRVVSAPMIREALPGSGVISTGGQGFSDEEAADLVAILSSPSLPAPLELVATVKIEQRRAGGAE